MNPEAVEDASNDVMKIILDFKLALFTSDKVKLNRDYKNGSFLKSLLSLLCFMDKKYENVNFKS